MINAAELLAAHAALAGGDPDAQLQSAARRPEVSEAEAGGSIIEPNPDRTHASQPRVRVYVAAPRSAS